MQQHEFDRAVSLLHHPLDELTIGDYDFLTRACRLLKHDGILMDQVVTRVISLKSLEEKKVRDVVRDFLQPLIDHPGAAIKAARDDPGVVGIAIEIFKQAHFLSHLGAALTRGYESVTMRETAGASATN